MTLWTRMRGTNATNVIVPGKMSPHLLTGVMARVAAGGMTAVQGLTNLGTISGVPLDPVEIAQATSIFNDLIAGILTRDEVDDIFNLAELEAAPYDVEAIFDAQLGI